MNRLCRALSSFNPSTRKWGPIPFGNPQQRLSVGSSGARRDTNNKTQRFSLISWNIDACSPRPISRAKLILSRILEGPTHPDIVFLQEVIPEVRDTLLADARVRDGFLVTDAEDQKAFEDVPFATMTLLSNRRFASDDMDSHKEGNSQEKVLVGSLCRITLPSKYSRDALSVDVISPGTAAPGTVLRLINVHLDSLWDTLHFRVQQMEILSNVLREPGCSGGIIAGDFNAIRPEDGGLVDKNGLVDAWLALHGKADRDGTTWGVDMQLRDRGLGPGRLDKVALMGLEAEEMEVVRSGLIEVPRPGEKSLEIPWSDHCGLRCTFAI